MKNYKFNLLSFLVLAVPFSFTSTSNNNYEIPSKIYNHSCFVNKHCFAIDITENKVDRGSVTLSFGEIIIHPGASWSIIDNAFLILLVN